MVTGKGAQLRSRWLRVPNLYRDVRYGSDDDTHKVVWSDWFFPAVADDVTVTAVVATASVAGRAPLPTLLVTPASGIARGSSVAPVVATSSNKLIQPAAAIARASSVAPLPTLVVAPAPARVITDYGFGEGGFGEEAFGGTAPVVEVKVSPAAAIARVLVTPPTISFARFINPLAATAGAVGAVPVPKVATFPVAAIAVGVQGTGQSTVTVGPLAAVAIARVVAPTVFVPAFDKTIVAPAAIARATPGTGASTVEVAPLTAVATAVITAPVVGGQGPPVTVVAVPAVALAVGIAPITTKSSTLLPGAATVLASGIAPTVQRSELITVLAAATALASAQTPALAVTIVAPSALAAAVVTAPTLEDFKFVFAIPAIARATPGIGTGSVDVAPLAAVANALATAPTFQFSQQITVVAPVAVASGVPGIGTGNVTIAPLAALSLASAPIPRSARTLIIGVASAEAVALTPVAEVQVAVPVVTATASANPPILLLTGMVVLLEAIYTGRIGEGRTGAINGRENGHVTDTVAGLYLAEDAGQGQIGDTVAGLIKEGVTE